MDPYQEIARHYDLEHDGWRDDVEFYLNIVRQGPVLEVGTGTGRVMEPLLEAGFEVWGVDSSPAMLDRARARLAAYSQAHLVLGAVQDLKLDVTFHAALLPLNVLWHFEDIECRQASLQAIRSHLARGALLVVDVSNPLAMADRGANGELRQRFSAPRQDHHVRAFSAAWDDEAEQLLRLTLIYDEVDASRAVHRSSADLRLRYVYRSELELLLRLAHFRLEQLYGTYDLAAYASESPNIIAVATAR
jgi:SAM-dependent methyltransferase